ncbi:TonB-dependent receptor plug domain-containing protein [Wenyingzhuangia sp. IMCC45574]
MNKRTFLFFSYFLIVTSSLFGQKKGIPLVELLKIYEEKFQVKFTSNPKNIENVFVKKEDKITSLDGAITFLESNTKLVFKVLDKRYITIIPQQNKIEYLTPVTLTYLTPGLEKQKDGSIALNTKEFGILPGLTQTDIMQTIQVIPGVESENDDINYLNIRGGTNDQNLVLLDGIKMYHYSHFFGLISAYDANLISKVEVIKNGTSSKYGDGVSSTINLVTKNKLANRFSGGIGSDLLATSTYFELPISKKITFQLSGRKSLSGIVNTITYNNYYLKTFQGSEIQTENKIPDVNYNSKFNFHDYSFRILYDFNTKNKVRFNFFNIENELDYVEELNGNLRKRSSLNQKKIAVGFNWEHDWNAKLRSKINLYHTNYTINSFDEKLSLNQSIQQKNNIIENAVKLDNHWSFKPGYTFLFGGHFYETGALNKTVVSIPSLRRTLKKVLLETVMYSELEIAKGKDYVRAGLRLNYFDKWKKTIVEPRFIYKRKLNRYLKLKFLTEAKHQTVNQTVDFKDNFLSIENRRWVLSNNQNRPILKSQQYSYGLEFAKNGYYGELTTFFKSVKGITALSQGFYNNFQFVDASGDYDVLGTEFLINKRTDNFSTWIGYIISRNDYTFPSFAPKHFRNNVHVEHSLNIGGNIHFNKKLTLSAGINWKTGNLYTKPVKGNEIINISGVRQVNYDVPNGEMLPNYFRLDISTKYQFRLNPNLKGVLSIGTLNVTNRKNVIKRYYTLDDDQLVETNNSSLKITPNVSLRFDF